MATDSIDANGLHLEALPAIVSDLSSALQSAYGSGINLASNSPDGQMVNIYAQAAADLRQLVLLCYNSFSIDQAYGVQLDQRVAINGIARKQGTYTQAPVLVTYSQAVTLVGMDALAMDPQAQVYTLRDAAGNKWQLVATYTSGGAGSSTRTFQALDIGQVQVSVNTITNQVTAVLGVTSVNNPTTAGSVLGVNEESDAQLRIRRAKSFQLTSVGPPSAVAAALLALPGVSDAYVVENNTPATVGGVPANSIWPIVTAPTATPAQIAAAIYSKKGLGCGLKGSQSYSVSRPNAQTALIQWDLSVQQNLYATFGAVALSGTIPTTAQIAVALAAYLLGFYKLGQIATIGDVVVAMLALYPNAYITGVGVSLTNGSGYTSSVAASSLQNYFVIPSANIVVT